MKRRVLFLCCVGVSAVVFFFVSSGNLGYSNLLASPQNGTDCQVSPTSLEFGTVILGDYSFELFTITNNSEGILEGNLSVSCDHHFSISSPGEGDYILLPGQAMMVVVRFEPTEQVSLPSEHVCTIKTGNEECADVVCSGNTGPCRIVPASLDFGTVPLGAYEDKQFTIINAGTGTLSGQAVETCSRYVIISGDEPFSLGSGEQHSVTVRFQPTSEGTYPCSIGLGQSLCFDVPCTGVGSPCDIDMESLDFGMVYMGVSSGRIFRITNVGTSTLSGTVSSPCADFNITAGQSYSIPPGYFHDVTVIFTPSSAGLHACTLETGNTLCWDIRCTGIGREEEAADNRFDIHEIRYRGSASRVFPQTSALVDTFVLGSFDFDSGPTCIDENWVEIDLTAQVVDAFHSTDFTGGGFVGNIGVLSGEASCWCGQEPDFGEPWCSYDALPGYGNHWNQTLTTKSCVDLGTDVSVSFLADWDTEPRFDATTLEVTNCSGGVPSGIWQVVDGGPGYWSGNLDYISPAGDTSMTVLIPDSLHSGQLQIRFHFVSDGAWSDEDGLYQGDGAFALDSLTVTGSGGSIPTEEFETPGLRTWPDWEAAAISGGYNDAFPGGSLAGLFSYLSTPAEQEYRCASNLTCLWGFFKGSGVNYGCGGLGGQLAVPYPNPDGQSIHDEIWSPLIPLYGIGTEFELQFEVYRDLPLDPLVFYVWHVRSIDSTRAEPCPGAWRDRNFVYYGGRKDWIRASHSIGDLIEPWATHIQIALGVWDMHDAWSGYLSGDCHSHAPLFDNVRVIRYATEKTQWGVRHIDLFQDNFAEDGTLTGTARADMAKDIATRRSPSITPGDSICITVNDPYWGLASAGDGPALFAYVSVRPQGQPDKRGGDIESRDTRWGVTRFPCVDSLVEAGAAWYCMRFDSVVGNYGEPIRDRYCFDLNDEVFTPGDTVFYVFGAENNNGQRTYWSRRLNGQGDDFVTNDIQEALYSPCEFTILPAGGWLRGGDILYVDDADDRSGPPQHVFDWAFHDLWIDDLVDRYDVLGPSSIAGNSLASRVQSILQLTDCYRKIIWNTGDLEAGLLGDGTGGLLEKSDDYELLLVFLDTHPNNPGLYLSGDDIAEEWDRLAGFGAIVLRSTFMEFDLVSGDHTASEPISPLLTCSGAIFYDFTAPDTLVAYGGCQELNDFDLLEPTGLTSSEMKNPDTGANYILSKATPNNAGSTARVVLSGFSYDRIRDDQSRWILDRVEHLRDILQWLENILVEPVAIDETPAPRLSNYLDQNYPNPFNPVTTIRYGVKERGLVSLKIYNVRGQLVKTLVNEVKNPAVEYKANWDGTNNAGQSVASGVYFYKLVAKNYTHAKKMVLLK